MFDTEYKQLFNGTEYIQKHGNPFDRGSVQTVTTIVLLSLITGPKALAMVRWLKRKT